MRKSETLARGDNMNRLEDIMLNEVNQRKDRHYDFTYMWTLKINKHNETETDS